MADNPELENINKPAEDQELKDPREEVMELIVKLQQFENTRLPVDVINALSDTDEDILKIALELRGPLEFSRYITSISLPEVSVFDPKNEKMFTSVMTFLKKLHVYEHPKGWNKNVNETREEIKKNW